MLMFILSQIIQYIAYGMLLYIIGISFPYKVFEPFDYFEGINAYKFKRICVFWPIAVPALAIYVITYKIIDCYVTVQYFKAMEQERIEALKDFYSEETIENIDENHYTI